MSNIRYIIDNSCDDALFAEGFDKAIIGVAHRYEIDNVVCYDMEKCIDILIKRDGMV